MMAHRGQPPKRDPCYGQTVNMRDSFLEHVQNQVLVGLRDLCRQYIEVHLPP